jgi:hypothetical protein
VSVDGTDFRIYEPTPFNKGWYSHKFHGPGVRYELGLSIYSGDIVWVNGPFPCGQWPDIKIFRSKLINQLEQDEIMVEADNGYRGEPSKIRLKDDYNDLTEKKQKDEIRSRHETVNRRFKQFGALGQVFRHDLSKHVDVFHAVVVLTQLGIDSGETLFGVDFTAVREDIY